MVDAGPKFDPEAAKREEALVEEVRRSRQDIQKLLSKLEKAESDAEKVNPKAVNPNPENRRGGRPGGDESRCKRKAEEAKLPEIEVKFWLEQTLQGAQVDAERAMRNKTVKIGAFTRA